MNARQITALSIITLMMSSVACSKKGNNNQQISPSTTEEVVQTEEKSQDSPDCSNLKGVWELDEELNDETKLSKIRFGEDESGALTFALVDNKNDFAYLLNGEEQIHDFEGTEIKMKGTCTNNGMLVIEQQVENEPKGRWVFVQMGNSPEVQLTLQEIKEIMDGPKGEEELKIEAKDLATGKISRLDEEESTESQEVAKN